MIIIVLLNEHEQVKVSEITEIKKMIEKFFRNQKNIETIKLITQRAKDFNESIFEDEKRIICELYELLS
ncbi:hypothetical protein LCGC14_1001150 [marine sediment metagenome]|uniref:Uncharacterized protein n=1 Tax=marine sediment metagenome TaxID=412755 RepID=A0A0F9N7S8_9ZZZZ